MRAHRIGPVPTVLVLATAGCGGSACASVVLRPGEALEIAFAPAGRDDWVGGPPLRALGAERRPGLLGAGLLPDGADAESPAGASLPKGAAFFP